MILPATFSESKEESLTAADGIVRMATCLTKSLISKFAMILVTTIPPKRGRKKKDLRREPLLHARLRSVFVVGAFTDNAANREAVCNTGPVNERGREENGVCPVIVWTAQMSERTALPVFYEA